LKSEQYVVVEQNEKLEVPQAQLLSNVFKQGGTQMPVGAVMF